MNTDRFRFRAWHKENESMVYFDNNKLKSDHYQMRHFACLLKGEYGDVLMQSTGLKDKNGALVYEGDVVEYKFSSLTEKFIQVVEYSIRTMESSDVDWINVGFVLKGKENDGSDWFSTFTPHARYKVIGNRFENPELLEQ